MLVALWGKPEVYCHAVIKKHSACRLIVSVQQAMNRPFSSPMVTMVNIIPAILVGKTNYYSSWRSMAILKVGLRVISSFKVNIILLVLEWPYI